jgi:tripartite-type tricarboxylate transporter receptor subunit TctC
LRGMIEFAKANPGRINYGSPGAGSSLQLMVELLNKEAGIQTVHVPYKGLAPAEADLLAGHIDMIFDNLGNALPYIRSGQFKALAVSGKSPAAELPDVPAIAEMFPDFVFTEWFAFVAPPKTDPAIAGSVAQGIAATLRLPDVAQRFRDVSVTPVGSTPTQAAALIQDESARWRKIVAQLGVKID